MSEDLYKIECNVVGKICQFMCEKDATTGHVKEALFQFIKHVVQVEEQAIAQQQAEKAKEEIAEVIPE